MIPKGNTLSVEDFEIYENLVCISYVHDVTELSHRMA